MKKLLLIFTLFLVPCLLLLAVPSDAAIPHLIRYQGVAIDKEKIPLEGDYTITFRIYDVETGGTPLWQEIQELIPISKGTFSVLLGTITPLDLSFDKDYYLSVEINTDGEMLPRQRITSVAYAYRAEVADNVSGIPVSHDPTPNNLIPLDSTAHLPITVIPQGTGSGLDADTVDGKDSIEFLDLTKHTGKAPLSSIPQGPGSNLDADTVDGSHKADLLSRSSHTGTQSPSTISPQGPGSGLNADQVDGFNASATPEANKLLALDASARLPLSALGLKTYDSGWFRVENSGTYTKTHNLGTIKATWSFYFSETADDSNVFIADHNVDSGYNEQTGLTIKSITTTQITVRTTGYNLIITDEKRVGAGYMRIIGLALE